MVAQWFHSRMRELREQAGLTQKQLAEKLGTTVRNISRLETAAQEPTWPTVLALCSVFGVGCDAFMQPPAETAPGDYGETKAASGPAEVTPETPKRTRGRPRKDKGET